MFYVDGKYQRRLLRMKAAVFAARIVAFRADADYDVVLVDTGGEVVASRGDIGVGLTPGQIVFVTRTDASGRGVGSGYVIISYPPSSSRNSSFAQPFETTNSRTGTTLSRVTSSGVDVTRVTLTAGGAAKAIQFDGTGLSSGATYGVAGITDDIAQVLTGTTRLVIQVEAAGGTTPGLYDLTLPGYGTIPDFFSVIA